MCMETQGPAQASGRPRILSALDCELGTDEQLQGPATVTFPP